MVDQMNAYEGIYLFIALLMIGAAELASRLPAKDGVKPIVLKVALTGALIFALFLLFNFLVVVLLIFTGAAAPNAPQVHSVFVWLGYLWLPWFVVRAGQRVYRKRRSSQ
ncbi:hypothetical protein [Aliiroseovarius marinus]|uniref:hypothetical protein n=1 Tax=Aliiroseovarius marinus TaxID=2500159 RepID=UPI00249460D4|nr:hypothetical protein [Aliiroseovarius marinus]